MRGFTEHARLVRLQKRLRRLFQRDTIFRDSEEQVLIALADGFVLEESLRLYLEYRAKQKNSILDERHYNQHVMKRYEAFCKETRQRMTAAGLALWMARWEFMRCPVCAKRRRLPCNRCGPRDARPLKRPRFHGCCAGCCPVSCTS